MLVESHVLDHLTAHATAEKHIYYGVSWDIYLQLLKDLGDNRSVRLNFNRGVLEIMSPKRLHEQVTRLVDMVVTLLAFELGLNVDNCGAMTLRVKSAQRGGEPDSCFYIANEAAVRGVDDIDLQVHPPPDIVLEVDITSPSLDKFGLYLAARIPEVWRYDGTHVSFHALTGDEYEKAPHSLCFPNLTAAMLERYLTIGREQGSAAMLQTVKLDVTRTSQKLELSNLKRTVNHQNPS
ncbi:MAG TPA: Uma2 family endonuclease [Pyrinomonadaceae bacterium]|jgi:Uma2 family endonuclease|nr:Uma2 family endonuclease [Pyrinomonadaceae bacterium]